MYTVGDEEAAAIAAAIRNKALFRYGVGNQCDRFEQRYAAYLGVKHFALAASGSNALAAAMTADGLGPGDEVLIPAHTYMASATSVLAAGAIPVIVDIDETVIRRFAGHRCRCFGKRRGVFSSRFVRRVRRVVAFLRESGIVRQKATSACTLLHRTP